MQKTIELIISALEGNPDKHLQAVVRGEARNINWVDITLVEEYNTLDFNIEIPAEGEESTAPLISETKWVNYLKEALENKPDVNLFIYDDGSKSPMGSEISVTDTAVILQAKTK